MKGKRERILYGDVNIGMPHFLIKYSEEYGSEISRQVAVMSLANAVQDMRLSLLVHDIEDKFIIDLLHKKITCHLFELNYPDPISYLIYHCGTLSNLVYSRIKIYYVPSINKDNILYFMTTMAKLMGIAFVTEMKQRYLDVIINQLFKKALNQDNWNNSLRDYNQCLNDMHDCIYVKLPKINNFDINEKPTIIEFASRLAHIEVLEFCIVLNYLKKTKLVHYRNIEKYLNFYHQNILQHQKLKKLKNDW